MFRLSEVARGFDEAAYQEKIDQLLAESGRLDRRAQRATLELLAELRTEVVGMIPNVSELSRPAYLRTMRSIDEAIRRFVERYRVDVAELQRGGFDLGVALAQAPLVDGGIAIGAAAISDELVDLAARASADLIQDVGTDLRRRINSELLQVVTGVQTPQDAVRKIGLDLTSPNHFRTIGARAQAIVVTEVSRIQQIATQARLSQIAGEVPGLKKRWLHSHVGQARPAHLEAEARYAPEGSAGPIDIDGTYEVNGHRARFPKDASLPASETVHCRCLSVPVAPDELPPPPVPGPLPAPPLAWPAAAKINQQNRRALREAMSIVNTAMEGWGTATVAWARSQLEAVGIWRFQRRSAQTVQHYLGATAPPVGRGVVDTAKIEMRIEMHRHNPAHWQWFQRGNGEIARIQPTVSTLSELKQRMDLWRQANPEPPFWLEATPLEIATTLIHELGHVADFASNQSFTRKIVDDGIFREIAKARAAGDVMLDYANSQPAEAVADLVRFTLAGDFGRLGATGMTAEQFRVKYPKLAGWTLQVVLGIQP